MRVQKTKNVVLSGKGWDLRQDLDDIVGADAQTGYAASTVDYDDTERWPVWKTAALVLGLCGGFWICAIAVTLRLLG